MASLQEHRYTAKIDKVLDYIDDHLDEELSVDRLSEVASFSKFHFHRQFSTYAGISVIKLVQLKRLKRASYQLVYSAEMSITDIALHARFENTESFSRAFKFVFNQTPSQFKHDPFGPAWLEATSLPIHRGKNTMQVTIVDFKTCKVAALEHRGPVATKHETLVKFIEWRKANGYSPQNSATFNIFYDDPVTTPPEKYRFVVCGAVEKDVDENPQGVVNETIPGGRCAVLRHLGSSDNLEESVRYLYRDWLPSSGEELRDFPCFVHRVKLPTEVAEKDVITDIYLPLN